MEVDQGEKVEDTLSRVGGLGWRARELEVFRV